MGEKVYIDLWGPASMVSLRGALYLMVFTNAGSSQLKGSFLSNKSVDTTLTALRLYVAEAERQTGNKVKVIQVDNGWEWINA
ncbi:hypothetical protein J132_11276 [Termitomyces sp. J132]|nr:hypothetical protein J132_11276 [Termitomyces sp. J132]